MAFLTQQTFSELQQLESEQYSSQATLPAGTAPGEPLGAIFNAVALLGVQQEQQTAYVASVARLATCFGADVDSFCAPFSLVRLGAVSSSGSVEASTQSPVTTAVYIPVGSTLLNPDSIPFLVIADTTQAAYNATLNAYVLAVGQSSIAISVVSQTAGSISNTPANSVFLIYSGPGSQPLTASFTFTNPVAFTNGSDTETDAAMKARFASTFSGQRSGAPASIVGAIQSVQDNLTFSVGDGINPNGSENPDGFFTVVVNVQGQSSGPGSVLIQNVSAAIAKVRPIGISYDVIAPTLLTINATYTLSGTPPAGQTQAQWVAATEAALGAFIDAIGLNAAGGTTTLSYGRCYAVLFGVAGVTNIDNLVLNGESGTDIVAPFATQIVAGTITAST
jgi:hypothetical protein